MKKKTASYRECTVASYDGARLLQFGPEFSFAFSSILVPGKIYNGTNTNHTTRENTDEYHMHTILTKPKYKISMFYCSKTILDHKQTELSHHRIDVLNKFTLSTNITLMLASSWLVI